MKFLVEQVQYPGFSDDPMDGFRHLADDLAKYCGDFLSGSGDEFKKAVTAAKERETSCLGFRSYPAIEL